MQDNTAAFVFPGQGSQKVGMLAELAGQFDIVKETFDIASSALGYDLWDLVQNGNDEELSKTHITQPAILTASFAVYQVWKLQGGSDPVIMAGHSLGEYSALTCAGALAFGDAVGLVQRRGQLMQDAVPLGVGSMAAIIGLEDDEIMAACEQAREGEEVAAVNFNSPGQVVIAGHAGAVARAGELCKAAGAKRALPLAVSAPFHSALMKPAAEKFAADLNAVNISMPQVPVLQNFGLKCSSDPEQIRSNLVNQIYNAVPWVDTINQFARSGITKVIEMGPGKVLNGLNKRIQPEMEVISVNDPASLEAAAQLLSLS
jgi:[acyl-carrier-protein] S-malonyltransferase